MITKTNLPKEDNEVILEKDITEEGVYQITEYGNCFLVLIKHGSYSCETVLFVEDGTVEPRRKKDNTALIYRPDLQFSITIE